MRVRSVAQPTGEEGARWHALRAYRSPRPAWSSSSLGVYADITLPIRFPTAWPQPWRSWPSSALRRGDLAAYLIGALDPQPYAYDSADFDLARSCSSYQTERVE